MSGTPLIAGTTNFAVTASNSAGSDTKALSVAINDPVSAPTITTASLPDGTVGAVYSQRLNASGTPPITWSIDNGNLPNELTLSATRGVISGTPTTAETANFTVTATNSAGSDTKALSVVINPESVIPPGNEPSGDSKSGGCDAGFVATGFVWAWALAALAMVTKSKRKRQ
jgi:hypothetical protein